MESELRQQYDDMGIEPSDDVIAKSIDLCITYHIDDATEFVEQWVAFSVSHLHGADPTVPDLLEFERKVLLVKRDKELAASAMKKKAKVSVGSLAQLNAASAAMAMDANSLAMYGVDESSFMDDYLGDGSDKVNDDVISTPKAKSALSRTPARHNDAALFSPASYSPIGTPRTHTSAPGSGKIVYTFGNPTLISSAQWNAQQEQPPKIQIKQLLQHNGESLMPNNNNNNNNNNAKQKYMFDSLMEKTDIIGDRIFNIGKSLCQKVFGLEAKDYDLTQVDVHSQDTVKTVGMIACDHDGPLDASSTLLIDSDESRCRTVNLNFSKCKSVGIFPGQIVMASGMNPKGDIFMVDEIFSERLLEPPKPPRFADQLSFVIAAGPYTHDDDIVYDPLQDLLNYLKDNKPNVLILIGPFLEAEHKLISEHITLAETFESFFEKMLNSIVEVVGSTTTILMVSSQKDANADPVYPTMPINLQKSYPNVFMLPDPSMIDLNGITIGMTSTDIVDHLLCNELAVNAGDKVKRVVNYLLNQGSFYPLHPPAEDKICYDSVLASRFANIEQVPNILILPSDQKCFIRVVNGCLAINPGRLGDNVGGTFARFIMTPPAPKDENNLFNFVGCQIRKV